MDNKRIKALLMAMVVSATGVTPFVGVSTVYGSATSGASTAIIKYIDNSSQGAVAGVSSHLQIVTKKVKNGRYSEEKKAEETKKQKEQEKREKEILYENQLYELSHLIEAEAGDLSYPDEMRYYTGSVVLNRVKDNNYPDNIHDVIFQRGQYACTWDGSFSKTPSETAIRIAEDLLKNGSVLPSNVIYQAQFLQGSGLYTKSGTEYFCYK